MIGVFHRIGFRRDDSEVVKRKKGSLNDTTFILFFAGFIWGALYFLLGYEMPALAPFGFCVVLSFLMAINHSQGSIPFLANGTALLMLITPALFQVLMGGYANAGGVILWSIFAPLGAIIFLNTTVALYWLIAFILVVGGATLFDQALAETATPVEPTMQLISFFGTFAAVAAVIFMMIRSFIMRLKIMTDEIAQKNMTLQESYEELQVQEEELRQNLEELAAQQEELTKKEDALVTLNATLEEKVILRTKELAEKNQAMEESIQYARRMQYSILPPRSRINEALPRNAIIYKPRDIVSGDFYFFRKKEEFIYLAAVDCTGHGVPGALMAVLAHNMLTQIVSRPGQHAANIILTELERRVASTFSQEEGAGNDGMDIAMLVIDTKSHVLHFSGAFRPLWYMHGGQLQEIKGDRFPIGGKYYGDKTFALHTQQVHKGDRLFMFSDGLVDQFGGPNAKKLNPRRVKESLMRGNNSPLDLQVDNLHELFANWKGAEEQTDDIVFIGLEY